MDVDVDVDGDGDGDGDVVGSSATQLGHHGDDPLKETDPSLMTCALHHLERRVASYDHVAVAVAVNDHGHDHVIVHERGTIWVSIQSPF